MKNIPMMIITTKIWRMTLIKTYLVKIKKKDAKLTKR